MTQPTHRSRQPSRPRLILAFLLAPAATMAPLAVWVLAAGTASPIAWVDAALLLGAGWAASLVLGVPAYLWLRRRIDLHLGTAVLATIAIFFISATVIGAGFGLAVGPLSSGLVIFTTLVAAGAGLVLSPIGALGGGVFWAIAGSAPATGRGDETAEMAKLFS